jgi:hypothetical protein
MGPFQRRPTVLESLPIPISLFALKSPNRHAVLAIGHSVQRCFALGLCVGWHVCGTSRCNGPPCVGLLRGVLPTHDNRRVIVGAPKVTLN